MKASYVQVDGIRHYLYEAGEGAPVLLLHGFTGSASSFRTVVEALQEDFHVIAVDLIGHGRTDAPLEVAPYRMESVVRSLAELMADRGHDTFACLGYSMGGRTGLALACEYPERVSALVLESASPGLKTTAEQMQRVQRDEKLARWIEEAGIDAFVDYWRTIPLFRSQMALSNTVLEQEQVIRSQQRALGLANSLRGMGTGAQASYWSKLGVLRMPVLLITGALDRKFTDIGTEMARSVTQVELHAVPLVGHNVHLEAPEAYADIVRGFLKRHVLG